MPVPNPLIPAGVVTAVIDPLLARLRSTTCQLKEPSSSRSVGGAPVEAGYVNVGAPVTCRVIPAGGASEALRGGRLASGADYEVRLPRGTVIESDYQIVELGSNTTMEIVGDPDLITHGLEVSVLTRADTR